MFTGIVEGTGQIRSFTQTDDGALLVVESSFDLSDVTIGDSVAVDGCCLTVVDRDGNRFSAELSHESLARTTFGRGLKSGDAVNLERALRVGDRMGGHFVQGHVDGVGSIIRIEADGDADNIFFECDTHLVETIVEKGSITVDGISLTVNGVSDLGFNVTIIPHTDSVTTLGSKRTGDPVNIETDIIGKYIAALMHRSHPSPSGE